MQILKYFLSADPTGNCKLLLPKSAFILSVQNQKERLVLWASWEPDEEEAEVRHFSILTTGQHVPRWQRKFLGTVQFQSGDYVVHVFEETL